MISTIVPPLSTQFDEHPLRSLFLLFLAIPLTYLISNEFVRRAARIKGFTGPMNWLLVGIIPDIRFNAAEIQAVVQNIWRRVSDSTMKYPSHCGEQC